MKKVILFILSIITSLGFAQNLLEPISWKVSYIEKNNHEGEIVYTASIQDKWHTYSQRLTDDGPVPTSFSITANDSFELIGKVDETGAHEEYVKAFEAKVYVFEHEAVFTQKIKRKSDKPFSISSYIEFMSCNDVMCNPPKTLSLPCIVPAAQNKP
jgi:thiol:disulfide interchange protein DsbD